MVEFTGERVIPGQVAPDLWNEHMARYRFAARLAGGKRVLDIGCGSGYGTAELAKAAGSVVGLDVSEEAVSAARALYQEANLVFERGDAGSLPFADASFDLVVAFEVIEHLENWQALLDEANRVLSPRGQLMVSTPNRLYYSETRRECGPNPYHVHEFTFDEFVAVLEATFSSVRVFLQNHVSSIAFQPVAAHSFHAAELSVERGQADPDQSHFFVAVCAQSPQTGSPTYLFVPALSNVLREREQHIGLLEAELRQKNEWLEASKTEHAALLALYQEQSAEMARRSEWGNRLQGEIDESKSIIEGYKAELQRQRSELDAERASALEAIKGYEQRALEVERQLAQEREATREIMMELDRKVQELARCVDLLHQAEATVEQRTNWALELQARIGQLEESIRNATKSRWLRLGQRFGIGPDLGAG